MAKREQFPDRAGVYYTKPPIKIYVVGSAVAVSAFTLIVLAWMFPWWFAAGGFLILAGALGWLGIIILDSGASAYHKMAMQKYDRQRARYHTIPRTESIIDLATGIIHAPAIGAGGGPSVVAGQAVEVEPTRADIMQVLAESDCVFVQGGRGAGKTNLMLWWIASKRGGEKIVCDPKGTAVNPWPGCLVVSDDAAIEYTVRRIAAEARRRKTKELFNEPPIYLLVDELHYLIDDNDERPGLDIARHVFSVITLGRQYNVHVSFTTSDGGVKSLGIEGRGGLRDGLTWIEMAQHPVTRMRECWIRHSRYGRIVATLPPVYNGIGSSKPLRLPASVTTPQPVEEEPDTKRCPVCDEPVTGSRATYCSQACRQKAYLDRRDSVTDDDYDG